MSKITVNVVFDDPVCNIGSVVDGQQLSELIHFGESEIYENSLLLDAVPKAGETLELWSNAGAHHFTVIAVHHVFPGTHAYYAKLLLSQIPVKDIPAHHWTNF